MGFLRGAVIALVLAVFISKAPTWWQAPPPKAPGLQGFVKPGWEKVKHAFRNNIESGLDRGGSFSVYHKGDLVVNLWGGFANEHVLQPWQEDTVTKFFSTSKGVGAIVMAILVDRGHLSYKEKVSKYWPEFVADGRADITVETLLSHQAGLFAFDEKYSEWDTLNDWPRIKRMMENQKPHWTPGKGHGYHGITIGLFMDQLVRLTDPKHRTISQFFEDEVAKPFGIDVSFGLPLVEQHKCTWMERLPASLSALLDRNAFKINLAMFGLLPNGNGFLKKMMSNPADAIAEWEFQHNPEFRLITNPSTSAYGTASGLAKLYGILANGGSHKGKSLIQNKKIIEYMKTSLTTGEDLVMYLDITYGPGFTLFPSPIGSIMFGTPGYGGQMGYGDTDNKLGLAYITNYLSADIGAGDARYHNLKDAAYECLKNQLS